MRRLHRLQSTRFDGVPEAPLKLAGGEASLRAATTGSCPEQTTVPRQALPRFDQLSGLRRRYQAANQSDSIRLSHAGRSQQSFPRGQPRRLAGDTFGILTIAEHGVNMSQADEVEFETEFELEVESQGRIETRQLGTRAGSNPGTGNLIAGNVWTNGRGHPSQTPQVLRLTRHRPQYRFPRARVQVAIGRARKSVQRRRRPRSSFRLLLWNRDRRFGDARDVNDDIEHAFV